MRVVREQIFQAFDTLNNFIESEYRKKSGLYIGSRNIIKNGSLRDSNKNFLKEPMGVFLFEGDYNEQYQCSGI